MSESGGYEHRQALPRGHLLHGRYELLDVLGVGGFGVTYLGRDAQLERRVAIKEYFPNEFAVREGSAMHAKSSSDREDVKWGLARFLDEARVLARFRHPNLVRVIDYFKENRTAYIVMDYEEGEPLDKILDRLGGRLSESQLRKVLLPVVDGLRDVHAAGFLHRDIKPSNVFIRRSDESPVLLDFGAARQALGRKSKNLTAVVSAGYSPPEQYESGGEQGVWTDIYALSALCYRAVTGELPVEATSRMHRLARGQADPQRSLTERAVKGFSRTLLEVVDRGLSVDERARPASLEEWVSRLEGTSSGKEPVAAPKEEAPVTPVAAVPAQDASMDAGAAVVASGRWRIQETRGWWLSAAVAVLVLVVGGVMLWDRMVPPQSSSEAPEERPVGSGEYEEAAQTGMQSEGEADLDPIARGGNDAGAAGVLERAVDSPSSPVPVRSEEDGRAATPEEPSPERTPRRRERPEERTQGESISASPLGGSATLVVHTAPPGVEVLVDGLSVGESPLERGDIRSGNRMVTLRHSAYEELSLPDQQFSDGVVLQIDRQLVRGTGRLQVLTVPSAAWIEQDGRRLAEGTPVTLELPAGAVTLTLGAEEHHSMQVEVDVPKGGLERLERRLESVPYGTLTLELVPRDARVELAGVAGGYQPGVRLPEGSHVVTVSRSGYHHLSRPVEVYGATLERVVLERRTYEVGDVFRDRLSSGGEGPELVVMPPGSFRMGCVSGQSCAEDQEPVHSVEMKSFALSKHEVMFEEYDRFASSSVRRRPDDEGWGRGRRPVINVSFEDAQAYASWLSAETGESYRLPSESEWEYAARAGTRTAFSWGNEIGTNRANCGGCGSEWDDSRTAPVGSFAANDWGLHDMHGNVWEWVQDCWNESYLGAPSDGTAWLQGVDCPTLDHSVRVLRGGSWYGFALSIRAANRHRKVSFDYDNIIGFRVARTLTP